MKVILILISALIIAGCSAMQIDAGISKYDTVADQIELGMTKQEALAVLSPTQESIPKSNRKRPEKYIKNDVKVEIYYMRSARQPDGLTTDDEFTPYLFNDGKLVGIGWQVLGGPKTQGQATSDTYINNSNTNTTVIY
ncbi:DUF3192 domain-containing protein [Psychromonas sp. RZ22]|uniref:DUF3192 domain-containing protein n=1 Tax=Psychromonas algarum TaxID=2555643 RepID=UPI00106868E5|nr:DUF3192 domain-containing protein [Psychromonas sp. RZ22]TEW53079.1 DUF3192 domain-containing protein [Psychromonas sp. RZ22]